MIYIRWGIIFLFIRTFRELIVMRLIPDRLNIIIDDYITRLLKMITKQTLIGITLTLMNQLFATCVFITYTWIDTSKWNTYTSFDYLLRGIEGMSVCILLYFGLHVNEKEYMKCCKYCHNACFNCCVRTTSTMPKYHGK